MLLVGYLILELLSGFLDLSIFISFKPFSLDGIGWLVLLFLLFFEDFELLRRLLTIGTLKGLAATSTSFCNGVVFTDFSTFVVVFGLKADFLL
jgi:hypothetical protein